MRRWGVGNRSIPGKEAPTVRYSNSGSVREQVGFLRRQFLQDGDLPFTDVLTENVLTPTLVRQLPKRFDRDPACQPGEFGRTLVKSLHDREGFVEHSAGRKVFQVGR